MSQEERIKRRKRKSTIKLALFGSIIIYFFFRSVPSLFAIGPKTELPQRYSVYDKVETEGIIIRDESVFLAEGNGQVKIIAREGERVPVGAKVLELVTISDTSQLNEKLEEIEKKIEVLSKANNINKGQNSHESDFKEDGNNLIDEIQTAIVKDDYDLARELKNKINYENGTDIDITKEDTLIEYSLDTLEKEKEEIKKQISNSIINYYSQSSGIISYKIDGYEQDYSINNPDMYEDINFKEENNQYGIVSEGDSVEMNQPIFKIINNFEWYILIKIDNLKDIETYEEGDYILLSGKDIIGELRGYVESIYIDKNQGMILCKFNTDFEKYYDKRHIKLDIIKNEYDTYKISKKTVIEVNGIKGVYIKDISGIVRFRAVKIIREDDQYVYISTGDKNGYIFIENEENKYRTVREFDEILMNPKNVEEGTIIN